MPEPGAGRSCSPNSTRGDGVNLGRVSRRPKPVTEDLGTDIFHGIEARGRRTTTTIPAGEIGNQAPLVRTSEVWTATSPVPGGLAIKETLDDPRTGTRARELVELDQRDPGESVFEPPAGYEIVSKSATETSCSVETAPTTQQ